MADITKTVEIIFGAKSEVGKVIGAIEADFSKLGGAVTKITDPLANVGNTILKVDAALAALAIGGMALAIKESKDFNTGFALISTSITATGGDLEKFRSDVLNYSTSSVKSIADINAALYTAAQAGVKYEESLDFIGKAEQLAVANKANLNTTVDLLTGTMNAYGYKIKDVGHLNDVFFTSTLIGKQTIDELGQSMGQVISIAANSGVSFEELSAAIATLTAKGMQTPDAITAVKNVITSIIAPSKEASEAAGKLGLNFSLTTLTSKGFAGMLSEIYDRTKGSKEKMVELFGEVRAMNGVLGLTGDGLKFFANALDQTKNSAGSAEANYKKMVATFDNQSQMVINTAKWLLIELGTRIEPIAAKIGFSFADVFKGIKVGIDNGAFDPVFAAISNFGAQFAAKLSVIAANLPEAMKGLDFSQLIKSLENLGGSLGEAFAAIFGDVDLSTAEGLHQVIQRIINGLGNLIDVTKGIIDGMKPLFTTIGEVVSGFEKMDGKTAELIGTVLGAAKSISTLVEYSGLLTSALTILSGKVLLDATLGIAKLGGSVVGVVPGIAGFIGSLGTLASVGAVGAAAGVGALTGTLLNQIPAVGNASQSLLGLIDVNDNFFGAISKTKAQMDETNQKFDEMVAKHKGTSNSLDGLSIAQAKVSDEFKAFSAAVKTVGESIIKIPDEKPIDIYITPDSFKKLDDISSKKTIDVETKINLEKLKYQSEVVQKNIEWKARIDIAQVEAASRVLEVSFKNIGTAISSTGDLMGNLIKELGDTSDWDKKSAISKLIEEESKRREETFEQQKRLTEAEIALFEARARAMQSGEGIIKIEAVGLQPHLEAIWWEVLAAVQVRANAEGAAFLTGI